MSMKTRLLRLAGIVGISCLGASCTTTYDAQGRPVQSVSPEGVAIAAVAAGVIGYAIADNNNDRHHHGRRGGYYGGGGYGRGGYGRGGYCR
jgi:hypothetical protein